MVMLVALLVLGPNKLPEAAKQIGKAISEFKRVAGGFQNELKGALDQVTEPVKSTMATLTSSVTDTINAQPSSQQDRSASLSTTSVDQSHESAALVPDEAPITSLAHLIEAPKTSAEEISPSSIDETPHHDPAFLNGHDVGGDPQPTVTVVPTNSDFDSISFS